MPNNQQNNNQEVLKQLSPVVNNPQVWEALQKLLQGLNLQTLQGLVTAQSELELYRLQGKASLLAMLLNLKNNYEQMKKEDKKK
jgi:hypothetical protein